VRDALKKLGNTLAGPPYNLALQERTFLRPKEGYWKTIEENFHWHLEILPQAIGMTGFERASWLFYKPSATQDLPLGASQVDQGWVESWLGRSPSRL
jgi:UDPglucose--hexose-1-phosphate uridylyltransferase